jgi:hypothetical protein
MRYDAISRQIRRLGSNSINPNASIWALMTDLGHERRLNGVHSSSACPPIATVMADVAALTLCARSRTRRYRIVRYVVLMN